MDSNEQGDHERPQPAAPIADGPSASQETGLVGSSGMISMATCGLCAEEIKEAALVCRFCGAERTPQGWRRPAGSPGVAATPAPAASGTPGAPGRTTNGLAIASLVLGILWLYWIGSILALVFGYLARGQIDASQGTQGGRGLATAGIVLGWIGVGIVALGLVVAMLGAMFGA